MDMIKSLVAIAFIMSLPASGRSCCADQTALSEISVTPVTIRLIRECEVPAHDSGVLNEISVLEGMTVKEGDLLAMR